MSVSITSVIQIYVRCASALAYRPTLHISFCYLRELFLTAMVKLVSLTYTNDQVLDTATILVSYPSKDRSVRVIPVRVKSIPGR